MLYIILIVLWIVRLNYLQKPESKDNEDYIENYYMLQGFVNKPRKGLLVMFYSTMNRTAIIITIMVMIFLGIYLFSYDKFDIFIKLNILILLLAIFISAILAIVTWYKRWYDGMGFLFKKQEKQ
jgi:cell division protein FtsW (lipid II flippase)